MELSLFNNLTDVNPKKKEWDEQELMAFFSAYKLAPKKNDRNTLFSLNVYQEGMTRKKENVSYMTGLVFDIDHKSNIEEDPREVLKKLPEVAMYTYSTWSHTPKKPRWRIVIPFHDRILLSEWDNIFERAYKLLDHPAVDKASKNPAAIYYSPYMAQKHSPFFTGFYTAGRELLKASDLPSLQKIVPITTKTYISNHEVDKERIIKALNCIDPSISYDRWIRIGMALHHEWGDNGFMLWDHWSMTGNNYPKSGQKTLAQHWKSFNTRTAPITIGTLFQIAKEYGFDTKKELIPSKSAIDNDEPLTQEDIEAEQEADSYEESAKDETIFNFDEFCKVSIYSPPEGLVKDLLEWFEQRSLRKNQTYSLSAAVSLAGFLLRSHIQTESKLKTNFLILMIGSSGSGKTHVLKGISEILHYLKLEKYSVNRIGSYQGGVKALHDHDGILYLIQDEAAYEIKSHNSKSAQNSETRIQELKLKTSTGQAITSDATKGSDIIRVNDPFFSEISASTEEILSQYNKTDISKGLLPRYLFFKSEKKLYEWNKESSSNFSDSLSVNLMGFVDRSNKITAQIAVRSKEAEDFYNRFQDKVESYYQKCMEEDSKNTPIIARLLEHTQKLSLLMAQKDKYGQYEISLEGMQWAITLAIENAKHLLETGELFSENIVEDEFNKVLAIVRKISKRKFVWKSKIYRKCRFITTSKLEDLLKRFEYEDLVELKLGKRGGKGTLVRSK